MVTQVTRKSMMIRPSGRSTDFISPSFGHGCLYNCSTNKAEVLIIKSKKDGNIWFCL